MLLVTSSDLLLRCVLDCMYPLHQNHIYTDLPRYLLGAVPQSYLRGCFLGYSPQ